ncbi:hypothetical protein NE237_027007 [Protea cynaroides]|uniref:Uncharacterized protein n=1 Tax=Protea cynaroides TaxID=273540 RepID=A0A9Q0GMK3_9MAGN|nr:hypothetical protein NE237_027007 [Protea cynaroides]
MVIPLTSAPATTVKFSPSKLPSSEILVRTSSPATGSMTSSTTSTALPAIVTSSPLVGMVRVSTSSTLLTPSAITTSTALTSTLGFTSTVAPVPYSLPWVSPISLTPPTRSSFIMAVGSTTATLSTKVSEATRVIVKSLPSSSSLRQPVIQSSSTATTFVGAHPQGTGTTVLLSAYSIAGTSSTFPNTTP